MQKKLDLRDAAIYLRIPPHILSKCITHQARKNGGIKLRSHDVSGAPHFSISDLDEFSEDLRKPWVDSGITERPSIPPYFKLALQVEAFLLCGHCRIPRATEFAHIEPWQNCKHHHPRNLICLCPNCHKGFDREKIISQQVIKDAKSHLEERYVQNLLNGGNAVLTQPSDLPELFRTIAELLVENKVAFKNFGPLSPLADASPTSESAAELWKKTRLEKILPNNSQMASLLTTNRHLYAQDSEIRELADEFLAHEMSYRRFVEETHEAHKHFKFPEQFADLVMTKGHES